MKKFPCLLLIPFLTLISCSKEPSAELIIINGKVYTFQWPDPDLDGNPSPGAPFANGAWHPEAQAIAITGKLISNIGTTAEIQKLAGENTEIIDAEGGTIIPGLVDSHTHVINLGQNLELVDLTGVETEAAAVALIVEASKNIPAGEWIIGKGWDEGAWASQYPDKKMLSEMVPKHPVLMLSLHSFASWANQMALDNAGITKDTPSPPGGEVVKDENNEPTGLFLNKGSDIIEAAIPQPANQQLKEYFLAGLIEMAESGYVAIHEAGVNRKLLTAIMELDKRGETTYTGLCDVEWR
jgi:predicted amidohydrolase YtcJ